MSTTGLQDAATYSAAGRQRLAQLTKQRAELPARIQARRRA